MIYAFENYKLDSDRRELWQGSSLVDAEPQVFDLLHYLICNRARVVSKDDLIAVVWNGRIVSESTLSSRITGVRHAVGDSGEEQRLIRTFSRKGFRFVGEVQEGQHSGDGGEAQREAPHNEVTSRVALAPAGSERRQLTIMVCTMVDPTHLSARVDPEDIREVMVTFRECVRVVAETHGGLAAEYRPDGAVVYFGYPHAHEDDAERAVRAGLAATKAVGELKGSRLQARVGIATGLVVVGDGVEAGTPAEHSVSGQALLLASRLVTLASPGAVLISTDTRGLLGSLFEYRDLGTVTGETITEPMPVSRVLRESANANRFEALGRSYTSPLVGREEELDLLVRRWVQAKEGAGRIVQIIGEPGIGKSRLTRALQDRLNGEAYPQLIYHCSPYHQGSALHPIIGQLLQATGIDPNDGAETKLDKLEAVLARSSENLAEDMALLAALLSIPGGNRYSLPNVTPQRLKALTLSALLGRLTRLAAQAPVLMVFEDLHWIDPTSLELLSLAVNKAPASRLLVITTSRPEFRPPWASHRHISTVSLSRLHGSEGQTIVTAITKNKALPPDVLKRILDRADGVPLFIEELTKSVIESDLLRDVGLRYELIGSLASLAIPSTLHASLLARLDRLPSAKDVVQIGAAIGREFSYDLISAISALPEQDTQAALAQLVGAEVIFQRGAPPDAMYLFKHALVQEAAYTSLVRSRRQQLHGRIARTLEERCPNIAATEPEVVAHHFTEAGLVESAIGYWGRAGDHSLARSAYKEGINHLSRALELLKTMPQTVETLDQELGICVKMGPALFAVEGPTSTEAKTIYLRALELVDLLEKQSQRFTVLWGLWYVNYSRGQYTAAREAGERLLDSAQSGCDTGQLLEAHHALWATLSAMGHAADAVVHMEHGVGVYDRALHASQASLYGGHDPGACCRYHLAVNLWLLGYSDQSLRAVADALRLTEELNHPATRIITLWYVAWVYYQRGDQSAMRASLELLIALAEEYGIPKLTGGAVFLLNIDARCGKQELAELHSRLLQATWGYLNWHRVFCLCVLADVCIEAGHAEYGLAVLASISPEDREAIYAPEIHRLEGELRRCLPSPDTEQIERCFLAARALARQRGEKSLELRAAMSIARFWSDQGNRAEARGLLKPVYDWFTEGFELRDLQNARVLMDDLARPT